MSNVRVAAIEHVTLFRVCKISVFECKVLNNFCLGILMIINKEPTPLLNGTSAKEEDSR